MCRWRQRKGLSLRLRCSKQDFPQRTRNRAHNLDEEDENPPTAKTRHHNDKARQGKSPAITHRAVDSPVRSLTPLIPASSFEAIYARWGKLSLPSMGQKFNHLTRDWVPQRNRFDIFLRFIKRIPGVVWKKSPRSAAIRARRMKN